MAWAVIEVMGGSRRERRRRGIGGRVGGLTNDRGGITALEYGIVAAFLCLSLLGIFTNFGSALTGMFNRAAAGI